MEKKTKKKSVAKKLIPATSMLLVSATMLASSTYAWFTMNREVEVKNIQMTATTPEDIQLSLGAIGEPSETNSLVNNGGFLTAAVPAADTDWSNIADISNYYAFGKLIPASSTDGVNVFYTADSAGVGRTLKTGAKFYQAVGGATQYQAGSTTAWSSGIETSTAATAHMYTSAADKVVTGDSPTGWAAGGQGKYTPSTAWNITNDDGYYVDIPIWLRTSSSNSQTIYVYGFACDKSEEDKGESDDLYKAVRVAILQDSSDAYAATSYSVDKGCLTLADGGDLYSAADDDAERASKYPAYSNTANILDSDNYNGTGSTASNKSGTDASGRNNQTGSGNYAVSAYGENNVGATWSTITENNGANGKDVVTLPAGSGTTFGTAKKLIIRVWLEGEDGNCWNQNANQDWNISLRFTKDPLTATP